MEWKRIPGYSRYEASESGEIRNAETLRRFSPFMAHGYPMVSVKPDVERAGTRKYKNVHVHRLVCLAFHGPRPSPQHEVAHNDGVRTNPNAANLRWANRTDNHRDKRRHGTHQDGDRIGSALLDAARTFALRKKYVSEKMRNLKAGRKRAPEGILNALAAEFGATRGAICNALWGPWWRYLPTVEEITFIEAEAQCG